MGEMADDTDNRNRDNVFRQDLVNTAVNFLQNPNVQRSSLQHKQAFLKSKGLTDEEIRIACEKSTVTVLDKQKLVQPGPFISPRNNGVNPTSFSPQQSSWGKFRDVANTIVFMGGVSFGLYILYKKYIVPWIVGEKDQKRSVEQSIVELDFALAASVQELRDSLNKVHADLKSIHESQPRSHTEAPATVKQVEELRAEIASVKGLLLNRSQFAPPVTKSPLTPPSIPSWQLSAQEDTKDPEDGQGMKGDPDIEDICLSGSGSSETEVVTNNGSDSSLEMIRE